METTAGIALFAAILTVAGLLGLVTNFFRRKEDEVRVGDHLKAREALTEKRIALLKQRRERLRGLREKLEARLAPVVPEPVQEPPAEVPAAIPEGLSPEETARLRDIEAARKRAKENPDEAAAVLRMFLHSGK